MFEIMIALMMLTGPTDQIRKAGQDSLTRNPKAGYEFIRGVYRWEKSRPTPDPEVYIRLKAIAWSKYERNEKREDFLEEMDVLTKDELKQRDELFE